MRNPKLLALILISLPPLIQAIPLTNSINLFPKLPTFHSHPGLNLSETRTHFHAILTHQSLINTTAQIRLEKRPLTVHIHTATGRHLIGRIKLKHTYEDVSIEAVDGAVNLHFRKRVPDLGQAIQFCDRHGGDACLMQLARRVCLSTRKDDTLRKLARDVEGVEKVLENCQTEEVLVVGSKILTRLFFVGGANVIVLFYGWGFLLSIASIPKELMRLVSWSSKLLRRIRDEGVKRRLLKEVMQMI